MPAVQLTTPQNKEEDTTEATWPAEMPNEELNEAPGIVTKNDRKLTYKESVH